MCEYCGCRQVEPIAELMDEHMTLLELAGDLRGAPLEQDAAVRLGTAPVSPTCSPVTRGWRRRVSSRR